MTRITALAAAMLLAAPAMQADAVTVTTDNAGGNDGSVVYTARSQGSLATSTWTASTSGASGKSIGLGGSAGSRTASVFVMAFRLPELPAGSQIASASLDVFMAAPNGTPAFNADLWGLGFSATSTITAGTTSPTLTAGDFNDVDGDGDPGPANTIQFSDTTDLGAGYGVPGRTKLMDNMLTASSLQTTAGNLNAISTTGSAAASLALKQYIQSLYDAGAVGGASGHFVFLRLSPDTTLDVAAGSPRYTMWTNNDDPTSGAVSPALTIEFEPVPEPASLTLLGLGGAALLRRH